MLFQLMIKKYFASIKFLGKSNGNITKNHRKLITWTEQIKRKNNTFENIGNNMDTKELDG
jgi:hypothetical protein